jgi:hypothetical protein
VGARRSFPRRRGLGGGMVKKRVFGLVVILKKEGGVVAV